MLEDIRMSMCGFSFNKKVQINGGDFPDKTLSRANRSTMEEKNSYCQDTLEKSVQSEKEEAERVSDFTCFFPDCADTRMNYDDKR
jgi:hypothetical protein